MGLEATLLALAAGPSGPGCRWSASRDVSDVPNELWLPGLGDCDADDDGYAARPCAGSSEADCDDGDPTAHPGAEEVCDGADNDCDQVADEGLPVLSWWADVDADGFGSPVAAPTRTCGNPAGSVANNADCDDLHANVGPLQAEIECDQLDNDCDPSTPDGEDEDRDGVDRCFDCDDDDRDRSPAHKEACDGMDNDCDGEADDGLDFDDYWRDNDGDGFGDEDDDDEIELCEDVPGWVENDNDCDDNNSWVNPDAFEWHCDGVDNDCSGGDRCP